MSEFKLPDVGEGLTEAEIVSWRVKEGDVVEINDIVVEIETAKSLVELPSPYAGTVQALLVPEGETVPVGTPIIRVGAGAAPSEPSGPKRSTCPSPGAATSTASCWRCRTTTSGRSSGAAASTRWRSTGCGCSTTCSPRAWSRTPRR